MLYNLVERAKHGGKQVNRFSLDCNVDARRWESTKHLLQKGLITKAIADKYHSLCNYDPIDWIEEEKAISHRNHYYC